MHKSIIISIFIILIFSFLQRQGICISEYSGEKIIYSIYPAGTAEYNDLGTTVFKGRKVNLSTFRTRVLGFDDTEKIYTDPVSLLPLWVERDIAMWLKKEYITEEYEPKNCRVTIRKFVNNKKVGELPFKADGPIHNAVLLPFYLRSIPVLNKGWSFVARFPNKFLVKLVSIEDVKVPAGKFKAYRFTSIPHKFEIWITKDKLRIPIKIKGMGGLGYTLQMKKRYSGKSSKAQVPKRYLKKPGKR